MLEWSAASLMKIPQTGPGAENGLAEKRRLRSPRADASGVVVAGAEARRRVVNPEGLMESLGHTESRKDLG